MALNARAAQTGNIGEDFTARYLENRGYKVLDRNWRIKEGELDIVLLSPEKEIVFVEVKTRTSASFGDPLESS
jgi:putative endonuclease